MARLMLYMFKFVTLRLQDLLEDNICRIDDPSIIHVASVLFDKLDLSSRLYPGSISTFRKQWNALLSSWGGAVSSGRTWCHSRSLTRLRCHFLLHDDGRFILDQLERPVGPTTYT